MPTRPTLLKVFLEPTGLHSRAMTRIAQALALHRPPGVSIVKRRAMADVVVMYIIGADAISAGAAMLRSHQQYVPVQCCLRTAGGSDADWRTFWSQSALTWSYYDLSDQIPPDLFYYAPLGIDNAFFPRPDTAGTSPRELLAVTTGYVSGAGAEAIDEVWHAIHYLSGKGAHIGPKRVVGVMPHTNWWAAEGVTDAALAKVYSTAKYVAALRHIEGFELPAAEGLACGARPILFDQPALRHWYGNHAIYVPDCSGPKLIDYLTHIMRDGGDSEYRPVHMDERHAVLQKFNWVDIAPNFWTRLLTNLQLLPPTHAGTEVLST
jgi:hypothetical protein